MSGWVKLYRDIPGLRSLPGGQRSVFMTVLQEAAWRDEAAILGGAAVTVPKGSWVTTRNKVAALSGVSVKTARNALTNLQKLGLISLVTGRKGAVISLVNPDDWEATVIEGGQKRATTRDTKGANSPPLEETRSRARRARDFAAAVIGELNSLTGSKYSPTAKAALADSEKLCKDFTPEQGQAVIRAKVAEWQHDEKMAKNLRPSTLLRPSNFARYAQDVEGDEQAEVSNVISLGFDD